MISYGSRSGFIRRQMLLLLVATAWVPSEFAHARTETYDFGTRGKLTLDLPEGWQELKGFMGVPLMLGGPSLNGTRPILSVSATGVDAGSVPPARLAEGEEEYRKGRMEWLGSRSGKLVSFLPGKLESWSNSVQSFSIGLRYLLNGFEFRETFHFVSCGNRTFQIKTLVRADQERTYSSRLRRMLEGLACR